MSHYAVGVIIPKDCDDVEEYLAEVMAPYNEELRVAPYIDQTYDELIREAKKMREQGYDEFRNLLTEEELYAAILKWKGIRPIIDTDDAGNSLSTYNPNAKWDWYVVNGRFASLGVSADGSRVSDIIARPIDEAEYNKRLRQFEVFVEGGRLNPGEESLCDDIRWWRPEYIRERYLTAECFAQSLSQFSTYAVITPNGVWHSAGEMGWFGMSSEGFEEAREWETAYRSKYLEPYKDWKMVVVDCHI